MVCRLGDFAGLIAIACLALALSGCGGGGGGGGGGGSDSEPAPPPPLPPPPPPRPSCIATAAHGCISTGEFNRRRDADAALRLADPELRGSATVSGQPVLELINVHKAHAALAVKYGASTKPGDGVTIAVMDSGVDLDHAELDGASVTETFLQSLPDEARTDFDTDEYSHGTAVTSIMAAERNNTGFFGIAWGATFKVFTVPIGDHLAEDDIRRDTFDWKAAYESVLASGADIVNASYSFPGTFIENYDADYLRNSSGLGPQFEVFAQRGVANPTIFVWIAGNDHGDPCDAGDENCVADSTSSTGFRYQGTSPNPRAGAVARAAGAARAQRCCRGRG